MNNFVDIPVDVLELLPWYVTNNLSIEDRTEFEKAVDIYPELREQLELEKEMIILVSADKSILNKRIIDAPENRLKIVFNKIDNPKLQSQNKSNNVISIVDKLKNNCDTKIAAPDTIQNYSLVASVGILVLSLATLSAFMISSKTETSVFIPASAKASADQISDSSTTNATILVGFSGTADQLKNNASFKGKKIEIKNSPDNKGIYQISFKQTMNADEIQKTIHSLQSQEDSIWFAGEAY